MSHLQIVSKCEHKQLEIPSLGLTVKDVAQAVVLVSIAILAPIVALLVAFACAR